ncbi:hypothetical protein [Dehalobacter restrictus]|uniref:Uncharacterized protein n=1 Tax=Dehalobacter restrictus TaxID=55583 RepID=A0A857DKG5_9FIRM|nr:hypothetical protein [Dehalobacter restrictus]QHA00939.1 hypothetical protein GQ588_09980 [Dehalobacter restrictus]
MKVCLIGISNLFLMPYLFTYAKFFEENAIDYDVIYWNRRNIEEHYNFSAYSFQAKIKDSSHKLIKLKDYLNYIQFVKRKLKSNNYDLVIVLTSLPAVLLSGILIKHYSEKFIVDVRDYTYEHLLIYKILLKKVLTKSAFNVISSPGFINFLPHKQATLCHNLSYNADSKRIIRSSRTRNVSSIKITYVGSIMYYQQCIRFIGCIANDKRFEFHFYGVGDYNSTIENYCNEHNIHNVFMHGAYKPQEKECIYGHTDIIFNVYGNDSNLLRYALSNKFYDAAWYRIPILVSDNTDMLNYSKSLSYPVQFDENCADNIFQWYHTIDWEKFNIDAQTIIEEAYADNEKFYQKLGNLVYEK